MIRLMVPQALSEGAELALDEARSRYLAAVMRLAVGDELLVFNGRDGEWLAGVAAVAKRTTTLMVRRRTRPQSAGPDVELVVALIKRAPLELIVEKAAELGAATVRLVTTERTNADHTRVDRLQAIAAEAAEQTGRLDAPRILGPLRLERLLDDWPPARRLLFCDEAGESAPILDVLSGADACDGWSILIGPEGGFSARERARLRGVPFATPCSLGPRILRAETAAVAALSVWQAVLGDWRA